MTANLLKIDVREFREHLPHYLDASSPVAITRHGETIGVYLPTCHHPEKAQLQSLKNAAIQLEKLISSIGSSEDELVEEFNTIIKGRKK